MTGPTLFDPGLQPERTALAWRRTLLTMAVGVLIAVRLLPPVLGTWSLGGGLAGLLTTTVLWTCAGRRARRTRRALLAPPAAPMPGGALLLAVALVVAAAGACGLAGVALLLVVGR